MCLSGDTVESESEANCGIEGSEIYHVVVRDCEGGQIANHPLSQVRVNKLGREGYLLSGRCLFDLVG